MTIDQTQTEEQDIQAAEAALTAKLVAWVTRQTLQEQQLRPAPSAGSRPTGVTSRATAAPAAAWISAAAHWPP